MAIYALNTSISKKSSVPQNLSEPQLNTKAILFSDVSQHGYRLIFSKLQILGKKLLFLLRISGKSIEEQNINGRNISNCLKRVISAFEKNEIKTNDLDLGATLKQLEEIFSVGQNYFTARVGLRDFRRLLDVAAFVNISDKANSNKTFPQCRYEFAAKLAVDNRNTTNYSELAEFAKICGIYDPHDLGMFAKAAGMNDPSNLKSFFNHFDFQYIAELAKFARGFNFENWSDLEDFISGHMRLNELERLNFFYHYNRLAQTSTKYADKKACG